MPTWWRLPPPSIHPVLHPPRPGAGLRRYAWTRSCPCTRKVEGRWRVGGGSLHQVFLLGMGNARKGGGGGGFFKKLALRARVTRNARTVECMFVKTLHLLHQGRYKDLKEG